MNHQLTKASFRLLIRTSRRLHEVGHKDNVLGALDELEELRALVAKLTPYQRAWLDNKAPRTEP